MSHIMRQQAVGDVANPAAGKAAIFIDSADGVVKTKLPNGTVSSGGGTPGLTPVAWALITLADQAEAVTAQVGDVIIGVTAVGTGEYDVALDPGAGLTSPFQIGVQVTCNGTDRIATYLVDLPSNKITILVINSAGAAVAAAYVTVVIYYAPDGPP